MRFEPNRPFTTDQPTVVVDAGLAPGRYVFRLEVVNRQGRRSQPVDVTVTVVRLTPDIVVTPVRPPVLTPILTPISRPPIR